MDMEGWIYKFSVLCNLVYFAKVDYQYLTCIKLQVIFFFFSLCEGLDLLFKMCFPNLCA